MQFISEVVDVRQSIPVIMQLYSTTDVVRRVECTLTVQDQLMNSHREEVKKLKEQSSAVCSSSDEIEEPRKTCRDCRRMPGSSGTGSRNVRSVEVPQESTLTRLTRRYKGPLELDMCGT